MYRRSACRPSEALHNFSRYQRQLHWSNLLPFLRARSHAFVLDFNKYTYKSICVKCIFSNIDWRPMNIPVNILYSVIGICQVTNATRLISNLTGISMVGKLSRHASFKYFSMIIELLPSLVEIRRYTLWSFRFEAKSQPLLGWGSPMARVKFTRIVARHGSFVLRVRVCNVCVYVLVASFPY